MPECERHRMLPVVRRHLAKAMLAGLLACGGSPAPEPRPASPPPPCTLERLLAFDPGTPVRERQALPAMKQRLGSQTAHLAVVKCRTDERDAACRRRAEQEVARAYPGARTVRSRMGVDRYLLRARYQVDGAPTEKTFETVDGLAAELRALAADGRAVSLKSAEAVPAPDARRQATVEALADERQRASETLRVSLLLAAPPDPVLALLRLQARASEARIALHTVSPLAGGAIAIELGCSRPLEDAD